MSVLFGRPERRAADLGWFQASSIIPTPSQAGNGYGGSASLNRMESSLQKVAVWACTNLVATMAEVMPVDVFDSDSPSKVKMSMPSWMADLGGDGHGLPDWNYQAILSNMLRGNLYGLTPPSMFDKRTGTPTMIQLQHPDKVGVTIDREAGSPQWRVNGASVPASELWHRRIHPVPGRLLGMSPIEMHALTLGLGISAMKFGLNWFQEGAHPSGILSSEKELTQEKASVAKQRFMAALRGSREPAVLGAGWKFAAVQIAPNESQFLETNNYTSAECCRIFGPGLAELFGYPAGSSLTYANVEQRSLDVLTYAVDPWLVRLERMLTGLLPAGRNVKFNRKALLKTDLLTRMKAHDIALRDEIMVVNEVRAEEDMPPVAWGNEPRPIALPLPAIDKPTQIPD